MVRLFVGDYRIKGGERKEISLPNFYLENLSQSGCIIFRQALFGRFIPPINKIKRNFCVVLSFKN